jgi:lysophospholipase L1-like esterase
LRSDHNYPHLVAAALGVAEFRDASCVGAGTEDMKSAQNVNPGPENPRQLDRLDAGTQVVTIGVGGNDIGFTEIIENCATADRSGTPCQDHYVDDGHDEINERMATAPKIDDVLDDIRSRSQDARVFVINYLSILPETGSGCWPEVPFADADVPYLRAKQHELNGMLAEEAAANDATLVDAFTASIGHDACQAPGVRWVEPVLGASGAPPVHPNQLGMECTAVVVNAVIAPTAPRDPALCAPRRWSRSRNSRASCAGRQLHPFRCDRRALSRVPEGFQGAVMFFDGKGDVHIATDVLGGNGAI